MSSIDLAINALKELRERRNNAIAEHTRAEAEPLPATSPISELMNAGYVARIPYRRQT